MQRYALTRRRSGLHAAGLELATKLVLDLCGGEASKIVVAGEAPDGTGAVDFPFSETKRLTGLDIPPEEATAILTPARLFGGAVRRGPRQGDRAKLAPDIEGKADIVEEILRITGVDNIVSTPSPAPTASLRPCSRCCKSAAAPRGGRWRRKGWSRPSHGPSSRRTGARLRRRRRLVEARQSDRKRALRHAPQPFAGPDRGGGTQRRAGLPDSALFEVGQVFFSEDEKGQKIAARAFGAGSPRRSRAGGVGLSPRKRLASMTPRPTLSRCCRLWGSRWAVYRSSRRAGLAPSGPLGHAAIRSQGGDRSFWRIASAPAARA